MFDARDDATGAGVMQRAKDRYWSDLFDESGSLRSHAVNILPDFRWRAWLDTLDDNGATGLADASVGMRGSNRTGRATMSPSLFALLNEEQGRSF